jgi:hypothetical protein
MMNLRYITTDQKFNLDARFKSSKDIEAYYKSFGHRSEEYIGYSSRANTVESQKFLRDHIDNFTKCVETFRKVSSEIKKKKLEFVEQLSEVSESSIASAASIKRAKAEAEKVRLEFVKKESELLKQIQLTFHYTFQHFGSSVTLLQTIIYPL